MKYRLSLILVLLISNTALFSQPGRSIRVKAGEDLAQAYSPYGFYRFSQFSKATLYFKGGGQSSNVLFNYNMLSGNMQFIGPKGDTLDLGNIASLDSIVFEKNVFVYNDGFMEVIAGTDSVKVLKKLLLKTQAENIGAYGQPNATASIVNIRSFVAGTGVYSLIINQDVILIENITWFFTGRNNSNTVKANKSNLLRLLPAEKQTKAETYLKLHKTSFEKEGDLKKLMSAIAG